MLFRPQAIPQLPGRKPSVEAVSTTPSMDIFAQLAAELDNEGRYHLLNAAANHLRFPNVHTHYFSSLMLALFGNAKEVRCLPTNASVLWLPHASPAFLSLVCHCVTLSTEYHVESEVRCHIIVADALRIVNAAQEVIQEQVTRVLLERLLVNRPHPWGLLITFIDLIKNPTYRFWGHGFTKCAPDIERLFDSVARSCMNTPVRADDGVMSGQPIA